MVRQQSIQFHRRFTRGGGGFFLSVPAIIIAIFIALSSPCRAERHALIIGIGAYAHAPKKLKSPPDDAKAVAGQFRSWKWKIHQDKALVDLNRSELIGAFCDFARRLKENDDVVIFYSGHGWEVAGELFLYPIDAFNEGNNTIKDLLFPSPSDVNCHADYGAGPVSLYRLLGLFRVQLKKLIVFYDACRGQEEGVTAEGRPMKEGASSAAVLTVRERLPADLTRVAAFSFATSPGRSASPGSNRSPYVDAFLIGAQSETNFFRLLKKIRDRSYSKYSQSTDYQGDIDPDYWLGPKPSVIIHDSDNQTPPPPIIPPKKSSPPLQTPP